MLGFAGWFGAFFLLGFVGVALEAIVKSSVASFVVGALVCAGAHFIFRATKIGDFTAQFGLAISLAGQFLMGYAFHEWFKGSTTAVALCLSIQQAVLFFLLPSFVHRVWTAGSGAYAASVVLGGLGFSPFAPAVITSAFIVAWLRFFKPKETQSDRPFLNDRAGAFVGQVVVLNEPIRDGYGRASLGDTIWRIAGPDLPAGQRVRVVSADGAVLKVEPA